MSELDRVLGPIKTKIRGLVIRGLVILVNDSAGIQLVKIQGLADEDKEDIERIQQYGHSANPPGITEAVLLCIGGDRDNMICIATDSRLTRKKNLLSGESAIYNGLTGAFVLLNAAGEAIVEALTLTRLGGTGAVDPVVRKSDLDAFVTVFNAHSHIYNAPLHPAVPPTLPTGGPSSSHVGTASTKVMSL